jgi:hypothetical protein
MSTPSSQISSSSPNYNLVEAGLLVSTEAVEYLDQKCPQFAPTGQQILNGIQSVFSPIIQKKYGISANNFDTQFVSDQNAVNTLQQGPAAISSDVNNVITALQADPAFTALPLPEQGLYTAELRAGAAAIQNDFSGNASPTQTLNDLSTISSELSTIATNFPTQAVSIAVSQASAQATALTNVITPDAQLATMNDVITAANTAYANDVAFFNALTPTEQELFVDLYPQTQFPPI